MDHCVLQWITESSTGPSSTGPKQSILWEQADPFPYSLLKPICPNI